MGDADAFGYPDEWRKFRQRNETFFERFPNFIEAFSETLNRSFSDANLADRFIFFLGRLCFEDLQEIITLGANGYGFGALKVARGMYERAVTSAYLSKNPDRTEDFVHYARVERFKAAQAWVEENPDSPEAKAFAAKARQEHEKVKDRYPGKTWSGIDFVQMARKAGPLSRLLVDAYYSPLAHAHGTAQSVIFRLEWSEEEGYVFDPGPQHRWADNALRVSHEIMLLVLVDQRNYFFNGVITQGLQQCKSDFREIWGKD